jgi:zinc protease
VFPDSEFESEHQVVSEERRLHDNNPNSMLWEQFGAAAQLVNPERNPTIGWSDDVERFTAQAVRDWYGRHYNPANAVLVVAGDVRPDDVRARVERCFGRLRGTPVERPEYYNIEPRQYGERRLTVRRRVSIPGIHVAFHSPGVRDSGFYVAEVAAAILGDGRSSRLYRRLVKELGLCSSAGSYHDAERDPGLLRIHATPRAESLIPRVEAAIDSEVQRMSAELVTERELQKVQNRVLAGQMFQRDDVSDMAYLLATHEICTGSWRNFAAYPDRIRQVTREQVRDFCKAFLTRDNRTTGTLVSSKEVR